VSSIEQLRGASPYRVAVLAGLDLSLLQSAALKAIVGRADEPLTGAELAALREAAGTTRGQPRPGGYRTTVVRAGRRSGKSVHVAAPTAVSAALERVEDRLAPGEVARILLIAPTLRHLRQLTDGVAGILTALGIPHVRTEREVTLGAGLRTIVECAVADRLGPRSGTAILAIVDEAALLPSQEGADGYDEEVIAAVKPSLATMRGRLLLISSPWAAGIGAHAKLIDANHGRLDRDVLALSGPTWRWNPTLSEAQTRKEEADERRWRREYLAEPGNESDAFFDPVAVRACVERDIVARKVNPSTVYRIGVDLAFKRDEAWLVAAHRERRARPEGPPLDCIVVDAVRRFVPSPGQPLHYDTIMFELIGMSKKWNNAWIHYDCHCSAAVESGLKAAGVPGVEEGVGLGEQETQWNILRQRVEHPGELVLLDGDDGAALVKQLVGLRVRLGQSGQIRVSAPERVGCHDDGADALKLACFALRDVLPGGGDIYSDVKVTRSGNGFNVSREEFYQKIMTGDVESVIPIPAPRGTAAWFEQREQRRANGMFIVGLDEDEDKLSIPVRQK
jgi:hypothetical protein